LRRRHDAKLLAGLVDDTDFAYPDPFVDPDAVVTSWSAVVSDRNLQRTTDYEQPTAGD